MKKKDKREGWRKIPVEGMETKKLLKKLEELASQELKEEAEKEARAKVVKTYPAKKKWVEAFSSVATTMEEMRKQAKHLSQEMTLFMMAADRLSKRHKKIWAHIHEALDVDQDTRLRFNEDKKVIEQIEEDEDEDLDLDDEDEEDDDDFNFDEEDED